MIPAVAQRYGGPTEAVLGLCRALAKEKVQVLVVTTDADGPGRLDVPLAEIVERDGVPMIFFRRQWSESFKYSRPLTRWLEQHAGEFDLVHIHAIFSHASLAAARASQRAGIPYLVRPIGSLAPWALAQKAWRKKLLWRLSVQRMLENAAAITCTSEAERDQACDLIAACRAVVMSMAVTVPPAASPQVGAAGTLRTWSPYVLALSRLHPVKGLELLIRAFAQVVQEPHMSTWHLVIAGDGDPAYVGELKALAARLATKGKIVFAGWLTGEMRASALRHAGLVATPSRQESFGLATFEAMGYGVPVLVSRNVDLSSEIERAGAGWVCAFDVASIAAALREGLSADEARTQRGLRGRHLVETEYTWSSVTGRLVPLYRDLLAGA